MLGLNHLIWLNNLIDINMTQTNCSALPTWRHLEWVECIGCRQNSLQGEKVSDNRLQVGNRATSHRFLQIPAFVVDQDFLFVSWKCVHVEKFSSGQYWVKDWPAFTPRGLVPGAGGDSIFLESRERHLKLKASSYVVLAADPPTIFPSLMLCAACTQSTCRVDPFTLISPSQVPRRTWLDQAWLRCKPFNWHQTQFP